MTNIFRQAKELIETKTCGEFTKEDIELVNRAVHGVIHLLPKVEPEYDEMPISEGLERLARMAEIH